MWELDGAMKTVVFLGAGASKAFGYPLTNALLPRIIQRIGAGSLFTDGRGRDGVRSKEDRAWFGGRLNAFLPGLEGQVAGGGELGVGVTDLLTLVDRTLSSGEARAGMAPEEVSRFRQLLERAIYEAILRKTERQTAAATRALKAFTAWLAKQASPAGVVTTNYDFAVDSQIIERVGRTDRRKWNERVGEQVDFGFAWRRTDTGELVDRPSRPTWRVHKLHGSVNWLRCPLCGQITMSLRGARGTKAFAEKADEWNTCHCDGRTRLRLHLVTPSLIRTYQDPQLLGIWQAALEELRTADRWVIVGYSLPAEDVAIRSLLLRAWDGHANSRKPRVTVVQRVNPATENTYRAFFPRERLDYRTDGLEGFLKEEAAR